MPGSSSGETFYGVRTKEGEKGDITEIRFRGSLGETFMKIRLLSET